MSFVLNTMQGADDSALAVLNDTLASWPRDYRLWFLRGALYAGQQRHGEARTDFVQTLALAPEFHVARFMLGLLAVMNARVEEAVQTWAPLDGLDENNALRVLKNGLVSLSLDHFDAALAQLNRGLALNQAYPLINAYVHAVVAKIAPQPETALEPVAPSTDSITEHEHHLLLSGYQGNQTRH